jgi:alginate O-acetyltransferase complex protein AlgJ
MKENTINKLFRGAVLVNTLAISMTQAAEAPAGIIGKDEWLYYRVELSDSVDAASTDVSLDLIQRFNKVLSANGISMAVVMVPLKMRIYPEHLPDSVKVNDYMKGNYDRMSKALQGAGVNVIDINTPFLTSPKRDTPNPFYYRLDTHWAPSGALLAAEATRAAIDANQALKKAFDVTREEKYEFANARRVHSKARDLVDQLPPNPPTFALEQVTPFKVSKAQAAKEDLLGNRTASGLTLVGSSYSNAWTGFPDALHYTLQRDFLSISVGADQGSWIGMESYLSDDSFQTQAPKLLIWEMPERDMRAPPDFRYRDARYIINNTEWLLRASAWVQASCKPSAVSARLAPVGLAASPANVKGADLATGPTSDSDFAEIGFDKPIERLDYLAARVTAAGSKTMTLEASGPGGATRKFTLNVPGDDGAHALKTPLPSNAGGFTKVRIYPGKSNGFALQGLQVCRQPEDLLK